jgi:acetylornithine deacetylase/succinyl-diaminopimelate desuccinylase-like protein
MMKTALGAALAALVATSAGAQALRPDQVAFRALYKELVETNTTLSAGSCTDAAARMAAHLKAAGFSDAELTPFSTPDHPKEGGLVAVMKGSDAKAKPILLLAHIDVVEAKREDWTRDPFTLVEEDGKFFARGTFDDKSQAAIWVDTLSRLRGAKVTPKRTLKLALTCGEETTTAFNGAEWLAKNKADLISAEYALNEGGGGRLGPDGKPFVLAVQVGEKRVQNYTVEATNPGGHSSVPRPDNAVTELAKALLRINTYDFPVMMNDTTRAFWTSIAKLSPPPVSGAAAAIVADPGDAKASAVLSQDPTFHSTLRTTCVSTLVSAGHANNALPQRATANVNCRIFPGVDPEAVRQELVKVAGDAKVTITANKEPRPVAVQPPLDPKVIGPMTTIAAKHFPGVAVTPLMSTGATDAIFLGTIGIPTYGVPGLFADPDGNGMHGLNEYIRTKSLYDGRDYLYDVVRALAGA